MGGARVDGQRSSVALDDLTRDHESESGALVRAFGREEGFCRACGVLLRDPRPAVRHDEGDVRPFDDRDEIHDTKPAGLASHAFKRRLTIACSMSARSHWMDGSPGWTSDRRCQRPPSRIGG